VVSADMPKAAQTTRRESKDLGTQNRAVFGNKPAGLRRGVRLPAASPRER
jgi:hypothetical protein